MDKAKIVYVKAELLDRQDGTALVRVLNGFGSPEIRCVAENVVALKPTSIADNIMLVK